MATIAMSGATLQMINHGISTGALFLLVGVIYERRHTRELSQFGGIAAVMPRYTVLFWVALFASIGLPGLNGFVGEFLILQGSMAANFWYTVLRRDRRDSGRGLHAAHVPQHDVWRVDAR